MADKSEKKGILSWISEALYETVPAKGGDEGAAGGPAPQAPAPAADAPADKPADNPADVAAKLRDQIAQRGPAFSKFLGLVASFAEIIPDEAGRYRAALKALEKTSDVTRDQILLAGKDQLQALESQRAVFAEAVERKRQALRESSDGVVALRAKMAELEQGLAALRDQEQAMLKTAAAEEGRVKAAEDAFASLLGSLQDDITAAREKIKKYLA